MVYARLALICLLGLATAGAAGAQDIAPKPRHSASARIVAELLSHYHYRDLAIDDALSREAFDAYFDALDPQRYYFLASDIQRFADQRTKLDDQLLAGKLQTPWEIFRLYRKRVEERADYAQNLLDGDLDVKDDESVAADRSNAPWPSDEAAMNDVWRKRIENDVLSLRLSGTSEQDIRKDLKQRYAQLARNLEQYNADDIFEIYMNAWAELYDPHTNYLSPRTRENFDINMSLSLQGIGALLKSEGEYTEVAELVPGGPAAKEGELQPGDRIVGVAQGDKDMVSVVGWRLPDVVELIRGPKASVVRLKVQSGSSSTARRHVISITRNEIVLKDRAAQSRVVDLEEDGQEKHIGVIDLPSFYHDFKADDGGDKTAKSTTRDVARLLDKLKSKHVDGLVVDLRGNAGGSLLEATKLVGLFVKSGPVVQIRYSDGKRDVLDDDDGGRLEYKGPLTVLVDGFSASASEIFAAAIQDYHRGLIVGHQTYGKGSVQDLIDLNRYRLSSDHQAGSLKFTRAKYYRITGGSTQLRGVTPDISLGKLLPDPSDMTERSEPHALPWDEIRSVSFKTAGHPQRYLPTLIRRHKQRVASSGALQALEHELQVLQSERDQKTVSLNLAKRKAEQQRVEQARLNALNHRLKALGRHPVDNLDAVDRAKLPDLVLGEAAHITADLGALEHGKTLGTRTANAR